VQGAAFGGAKIWNSEIWPLLANWRLHWQLQLINLSSTALRNYTPNLAYCSQSTLMSSL